MRNNLKTAFISNQNQLSTIPGWYVMRTRDTIFSYLLNPIPAKKANVFKNKKSASYLLSGSLSVKEVEEHLPPSAEEPLSTEKIIMRKEVTLSPSPDDLYYYRFFLDVEDNISFSSDINILLDDQIEDHFQSEKYVRIVYASLPLELPLILKDNQICVSL